MTAALDRVNWAKARFLMDAIEAWEEASQERFRGEPAVPPAPPPRRASRGPAADPPEKGLLGNWRERMSPAPPTQPEPAACAGLSGKARGGGSTATGEPLLGEWWEKEPIG